MNMKSVRDERAVKVTDLKSGEFQVVDNTRSHHKNVALAKKVLANKLHALNNGIERSDKIVADYWFPDDVDFPDNVKDYKK